MKPSSDHDLAAPEQTAAPGSGAKLPEFEEYIRLVGEVAGVQAWEWDIAANTARYFGEPAMTEYLALRTYEDWLHFVHPDDREEARRKVEAALARPGTPYINEYRAILSDGSVRCFASRGKVFFDRNGKPVRMLGANIDITSHRQTIAALHDHNRRLAVATELGAAALKGEPLSPLMNRIVKSVAETLNVEYSKVLEWRPDQDLFLLRAGTGWRAGLVGAATVPAGNDSQAGYTLRSGAPVIVEDLRAETRFSGPPLLHEHDVVSGISVIIQGESRPWGVLGAHTARRRRFDQEEVHFLQTVANILAEAIEHKRALDELQQSETKFRGLLESAADGIVIANARGEIEMINAHLEKLTGYRGKELIGQPVEILVPESFSGHESYRLNYLKEPRARMMGDKRQPLPVRCKDGSEFLAEISLVPLQLVTGTIVSVTIRDVSDRVRAERNSRETQERLRNLASRLHAAREEERTRVAREIHDELGQSLTGLKMDLSWLLGRMPRAWKKVRERVRAMITLVETTIVFVRGLATSLRPAILDDLGLAAAIEWQLQGYVARSGCGYKLELPRARIKPDSHRDTTVFRIFQEALTNIARHARADAVEVALRRADAHLILTIKDNGVGIPRQKLTDNLSLGLIGMRERAAAIGGEFQIESERHKGTRITLTIPLSGKTGRQIL
jgi:PAS domain S-box-containing protein